MSESSTLEEERTSVASTRQLLARIFYRPSEVFVEQKQSHTWGRIFVLLVVISLVSGWLTDLSPDPATVSTDRVDATVGGQSSIEMPTTLHVLSTLFVMAILLFIEALYLRIVSAIMGLGMTIDHWFAMVAWARVPAEVLALLMTIVLVATSFVSVEFFGLDVSIFKGLLYGFDFSNPPLGYFLDIWLLPEIWVIALMTIGFRAWSGLSTLISAMIVVAPFVVFYLLAWWAFS